MNWSSITLDLDGTLVDSARDLTLACQGMLADLGEPATDEREIRSFIGEGMIILVRSCLTRTAPVNETRLEQGIALFRQHYRRFNGSVASLYPGVQQTLAAWQAHGLKLACVTNKPMEFTVPLLEKLGLRSYFQAVVGGDSCAQKKPRPEPLLLACRELGVLPHTNLHIGDSRHDIVAARAAGCAAGGIPYGYPGTQPLCAEDCDLFFPLLSDFPV